MLTKHLLNKSLSTSINFKSNSNSRSLIKINRDNSNSKKLTRDSSINILNKGINILNKSLTTFNQ